MRGGPIDYRQSGNSGDYQIDIESSDTQLDSILVWYVNEYRVPGYVVKSRTKRYPTT